MKTRPTETTLPIATTAKALTAKATKRRVDALLPEGYEVVQGRGYVYFWGDSVPSWYTSSIAVCRIGDMTVGRVLEHFNLMRAEYERDAA